MFKIIVEKECSCFKKSNLENRVEFQSKDSALMEAMRMATQMNDEFCGKHEFQAVEDGDVMTIRSFSQEAPSGGCCGGGCH